MSAVFGRRRRLFGALAWTLFAAVALCTVPAHADEVSVSLDEARIMKLPDRVATVVIGNPLIADAALQGGGVLVLTGKGFGSTNLLALDRAGKVVMNTTIQVVGPASRDLVVVYKGIDSIRKLLLFKVPNGASELGYAPFVPFRINGTAY